MTRRGVLLGLTLTLGLAASGDGFRTTAPAFVVTGSGKGASFFSTNGGRSRECANFVLLLHCFTVWQGFVPG